MAGILDTVDSRTNLVGQNRLELLLFHLQSSQLFALNVFKVKEVLKLPKLNSIPNSHPSIAGVANIRGKSTPVIDLRKAVGLKPIPVDESCNLVVTEYNRTVQAFLIGAVDHIVNMEWSEIMPPPNNMGRNHYLTAITKHKANGKERLVEIIDVEKVLAEIVDYDIEISEGIVEEALLPKLQGKKILHADDSSTARKQVADTLKQLGIEIIPAQNGLEAFYTLKEMADSGVNVCDELLMVITDAEMPAMDGYRLTFEIRNEPKLKDLFVVLNTSLSGSFNQAMVEKVGCDRFISKFQPDELVKLVQDRLKQVN
jgi:two-component system chemotaxis response regulator CheV